MKFLLALGAALALASPACSSGQSPDTTPTVDGVQTTINRLEEITFSNFKRAIETADDDGYTPYWLGRKFNAADVTFSGPNVDGTFDGLPGGGVTFTYHASSSPGRVALLHVEEYSPAGWSRAGGYFATQSGTDVRVAGHPAKLYRLESLYVVIDAGDTTIVVHSQSNPLADQSTLLAVLRDLRPYPD